jgi:hypothetical protein
MVRQASSTYFPKLFILLHVIYLFGYHDNMARPLIFFLLGFYRDVLMFERLRSSLGSQDRCQGRLVPAFFMNLNAIR